MTDHLAAWQALISTYDVNMFCGAFMRSENDGLSISAENMLAVGARGIELDLDIYSPVEGTRVRPPFRHKPSGPIELTADHERDCQG